MPKQRSEKVKTRIVNEYLSCRSTERICRRYEIPRSTLYYWIKQYAPHKTDYGSVTVKEFDSLKRKVKKLENMVQALQGSEQIQGMTVKEKEKAIDVLYGKYSVHTLCDAFMLSRATFYNYKFRAKHQEAWYEQRKAALKAEIEKIYEGSMRTYGARRICAALRRNGHTVGERYVSDLMH